MPGPGKKKQKQKSKPAPVTQSAPKRSVPAEFVHQIDNLEGWNAIVSIPCKEFDIPGTCCYPHFLFDHNLSFIQRYQIATWFEEDPGGFPRNIWETHQGLYREPEK